MSKKTMQLAGVGMLTALVIVLQVVAGGIRFGIFNITLALFPIIVGAALYGYWVGAWLGFVFGMVVLLSGQAATFLVINIPGTIITVLLKGTAAGLLAGVAYHLLEKRNRTVAVIAAGIASPVANTGIFLIGCCLFFFATIKEWAAGLGYASAASYMFLGLAGGNFLVELVVNLVLSSAIVRIIQISTKMFGGNK